MLSFFYVNQVKGLIEMKMIEKTTDFYETLKTKDAKFQLNSSLKWNEY